MFGRAHRIDRAFLCGLQPDLHPIDHREANLPGRLPEPGDAVEPVVVGYGQRVVSELDSTVNQVLGMGGTVEEREVGVTVQLGVHLPNVVEHTFDYIWDQSPTKWGKVPPAEERGRG